MFLASKPNSSSKYFVFGSVPDEPSEVRLLTSIGFAHAGIRNEDYTTLSREGWLPRRCVRVEKGEAVTIGSLWEPTRHGDVSHDIAVLLQYTFAIIGKLHVGHVVHSVSLLRNIMEAEEDGQKLSNIDLLHQSMDWKTFVLHCWIEQAANEIKDRRSIFWQRCLLRCHSQLQDMVSELPWIGKETVFEVMKGAYIENNPDHDHLEFMESKKNAVYGKGNKYICLKPFSSAVGFLHSKKIFYSLVLGYHPPSLLLPKNIDMARALSKSLPPPQTASLKLWQFFGISSPPNSEPLVTLNYCSSHSVGREFAVASASSINDLEDMSAGEILSGDMWVTALTLDIDGKTIDARIHSPCIVYKSELVLQDLIEATRQVMMEELHGRWDLHKRKPSVHLWQATGEDNRKLSMRISLHLPENVTFTSIDAVREFVKKLVTQVKSARCRYLTVSYLIVNGSVRFEMSLKANNDWFAIINNELHRLEDYIYQATGKGEKVCLQSQRKSYTLKKSFSCSFVVVEEGNPKATHVFDLTSWLSCTVRREAFIESFIDDSIYFHNHSLRLPGQSKLEGMKMIRKFTPWTPGSLPIDALMHYPHTDTPPLPGAPILIEDHSTQCTSNVLESNIHEDEDVEIAKEFIVSQYNSRVTKITRGKKLLYLDLDCETCLVKGGTHSNARMYLVYDRQTRELLANCWSSKCRDSLRQKGSTRGLFLCDLSRRSNDGISHHNTPSDI